MGAVVLLVVAVLTLFVRPDGWRWWRVWTGPGICAVVGVATTAIRWGDVDDSLRLLRDPLLFLVFAVPLAVALDHIGVFAALAAAIDHGRHLVAGLWVLAAAVTIVFNLDAAVVLLTPLYIRIARRHGFDPVVLAFQPALLACLASGVLPVSNLTNLIAAERFDLDTADFVRHLALPTLVAVVAGWWAYRATFHLHPTADGIDEPVDGRALWRGLPIVGLVLIGFTLGDLLGVPAWLVAAVALAWAMASTRGVPWRAVPVDAVLVAVALAVVVAGAVPHLGLERLLDAGGVEGDLRALAFGVVGSNVANNLPAVLAGTGALHHPGQVWALLLGVNLGPLLVITGSLSGLLWRDTAGSLGVPVSARRYTAVGARVGLPAMVAAAAVLLLTR